MQAGAKSTGRRARGSKRAASGQGAAMITLGDQEVTRGAALVPVPVPGAGLLPPVAVGAGIAPVIADDALIVDRVYMIGTLRHGMAW